MGIDDKIENKAEEMKGEGKETIGRATDDEELVAEGQMDQAKGNIKQAGEKIKDIFKK
ncbi:MAG: CsbD family protein [Pseudonocardiales bacterium]|jgi:uncharacterized protein YjbJ (UPF0337 family)|nr:CsbD family protein [Pseudonocardiales bacterium]MBV9649032.1 CsbD family protein [Pseudonocardiales bacterium]